MLPRLAVSLLFAMLAFSAGASGQGCPGNPGALGTSRVVAVDPSGPRKLGLLEYDDTLPLGDHEAVLTFDDGPIPPYTTMVLDALAAECVKATFFIVGQQAEAHPGLVQREYREGHTIGTHTEHHPHLDRLPPEAAKKEISNGIALVRKALGESRAIAPFFRFPYLDATPQVEAVALRLGLTIWNTDMHVNDWDRITPDQVVALAIARLEKKKKGILLMHDIHERTALALPKLLRALKGRGFHIVHAVPLSPDHPITEAKPHEGTATN
jgi:peptidoglycan/xylan/chitin deacetylase (PgdA/CDA1 family)